jgi:hypothetical protein
MSSKEPWRESAQATVPSVGPTAPGPELLTVLFGQMGIASFRAAVVGLASMDMRSTWSHSAERDPQLEATDAAPDSAFIAARDAGISLRDAPTEYTMVRKLSPRVWSFAWRVNADLMVIAEVRYLDRRDTLGEADSALVRLVFMALSQPEEGVEGQLSAPGSGLEWPAVDRRRNRDGRALLRSQRVPLMLLGLSALLTLWLSVISLPAAGDRLAAQQSATTRLQGVADKTVTQQLTETLATGDYGEVQAQLTHFQTLGYFPSAVVLNARQRVVASVGMGGEVVIGAAVPATVSAAASAAPLVRGTEQFGQLLQLGQAEGPPEGSIRAPWIIALASCLAALAAAVTLVVPAHWRSR